jgi:asparagine synthase (glutamine-hydrolysing)
VHKLGPGECLVHRHGESPKVSRYWSMAEVARDGLANQFDGSDAQAVDALEALLLDAVGRRMVADVPLGAFLSGGIDSSTVVALMQAQSARPVRSFSIGFHETGYDEATHAKAVAAHLGTDHTELYVAPAHALEISPRIPDYYDEPFADSSQIPTYLVSEMTREHVTVSLSGDGGDELFTGYRRYFLAESLRHRFELIPKGMRRVGSTLLSSISPGVWDALFRVVPARLRPPQPGDKVHKLASILAEDPDTMYRRLVSQIWDPGAVVPGVEEPHGTLWDPSARALVPEFTERLQYLDTITYLPDDILTKVDRATMAVSLEARVPLLDHRVVEFAWRLPLSLKIRGAASKWPLRQVLYRHVPRALVERPKMGFGVPIDGWMRGPLRDWAEDLLDPRRLREEGLLDPDPVHRWWGEHLSGTFNHAYALWNVLMFQAWRRRWV